jgi:hypothetical protein
MSGAYSRGGANGHDDARAQECKFETHGIAQQLICALIPQLRSRASPTAGHGGKQDVLTGTHIERAAGG